MPTDDTTTSAEQDAQASETTAPTGQDTPTPTVQETPAQDAAKTGDTLPDDPATLKRLLHDARREAAANRVAAREDAAEKARKETLDTISRALGLTPTDEAPTVETLTGQLTAEQEARRAAQTQLAVYRAATGVADPDLLLDSKSFTDSLTSIDPTDSEAVKAAVRTFVDANPRFRNLPQAGSSTVDHAAGSGDTATLDQFKTMSGEQRNHLYKTDPATYRALAAKL